MRILAALANERPHYHIPPVKYSHLRVYLHENSRSKPHSKQKVFDPFVVLTPQDEVTMVWPNTSLGDEDRSILDEMLSSINYLGRSESWCDLRLGQSEAPINCQPVSPDGPGENYAIIRVAGMVDPQEYQTITLGKKLSVDWLDSLALSTKDIEKFGLDTPPTLQFHDYVLDPGCIGIRKKTVPSLSEVREIVYNVEGKVKVPVKDTVKVSEGVRRKLMGVHRRIMGDPSKVSTKFSGKNRDGVPLKGHVHCYIAPMDENDDGFIDHLSVRCNDPFDHQELLALDRLERLGWTGGHDILFTPIRTEVETPAGVRVMVSRTPYVSPRHHRKGRGDFMEWMKTELLMDLRDAGLPKPSSVEAVSSLPTLRGNVQWFEFIRSRKNDQANFGFGFRLVFDTPVPGKFNVGYGAHYGLGLFVPDRT